MPSDQGLRLGRTLLLKDDPAVFEKYEHEHRQVWPEMIAFLHRIGYRRMTIFRKGPRLFMFAETEPGFDAERAAAEARTDPVSVRWEAAMSQLQERAPEAEPHEWWSDMDTVFDTDWF